MTPDSDAPLQNDDLSGDFEELAQYFHSFVDEENTDWRELSRAAPQLSSEIEGLAVIDRIRSAHARARGEDSGDASEAPPSPKVADAAAQTLRSTPNPNRSQGRREAPTGTASGNLHGLERFGDYQILDSLGTGSFATVYKAWDETAAREVALKILRSKSTFSEDVRARFLREARAMAKLDHDHIVRIYHVISENDVLGLCMELVQGESLESRLQKEPRLEPEHAARIAVQLCSALGAVHDAGFVHRDIKAENIMMDGDRAVLMDFGISRPLHDEAPVTAVGVLVGTPIAMAPEQHQFKGVDARTDIYALGSLLFRLLCGSYPILAESMQEMRRKVIEADYPRLLEVEPSVPAPLAEIVGKAMQASPEDRFASTLEMENELRKFVGMPARTDTPQSGIPETPAPQERPRSRIDRILLVAILIALVTIIILLLLD